MTAVRFPVILAAFLAVAAARAQSLGNYSDARAWPDTPAAKRAQEVIQLVNAGDAERIKAFIADAYAPLFRESAPLEQHLGAYDALRKQAGSLDFYGVRKYEQARPPNELVAIMKAKLTDSWMGLVIEVDPNPPHHVSALQFAPARPPLDAPAPAAPLTESQMIDEIRLYCEKLAAADVLSGAVLVARHGKVLFRQAYGHADLNFNVPNRPETRFNLGSMNKMFTAVAIAQLVERGKLGYDDPLVKYLDASWLDPALAVKITINHCLTHTSGLGSYFNDQFIAASRERFREISDYKPLVVGERTAFEPGADWAYSNTGFLLLGAVIEKVTGRGYNDFIRENIARPAGMTDTDCFDVDRPIPNLAVGYTRVGDHLETNTFKHVIRGGPAGGGFSTVDDLLKFDLALRANKLVSAETAAGLWTPTQQSAARQGYGRGFSVRGGAAPDASAGSKPRSARVVGHNGGFPGVSSVLEMHLDTGFTVVALSNYDQAAVTVAQKISELIARCAPN